MKTLISMTDFILNFKGNTAVSHKAFEFARKSKNYANFLKQPLTIEFIQENFVGFELKIEKEKVWMFKINGLFPYIIGKTMTVESLLIYKTEIQLTELTIKKLGL